MTDISNGSDHECGGMCSNVVLQGAPLNHECVHEVDPSRLGGSVRVNPSHRNVQLPIRLYRRGPNIDGSDDGDDDYRPGEPAV